MRDQLILDLTACSETFMNTVLEASPDLSRVRELTEAETDEVLSFLAARPVHTVVMASFINDNGLRSELNRGKFYGSRDRDGKLDGVALIGHTTLLEARSESALSAFAHIARTSETPIHLIMSHGTSARAFWNQYSDGITEPRLTCVEKLFELSFPLMVRSSGREVRLATASELLPVAEAQAEVAFMECGVDPMIRDREGFLKRVQRRIDQGRVFVVFEGEKLLFKADIIAEANDAAYLEGVYVHPEFRGQGIGSACLSELAVKLLDRVSNVCLLSNVDFETAHRTFHKAGFASAEECVTLFV